MHHTRLILSRFRVAGTFLLQRLFLAGLNNTGMLKGLILLRLHGAGAFLLGIILSWNCRAGLVLLLLLLLSGFLEAGPFLLCSGIVFQKQSEIEKILPGDLAVTRLVDFLKLFGINV